MYKIEKMSFGFKVTFDGFIKAGEMARWVSESQQVLAKAPEKFGVFVDMRGLKPLPEDAQEEMKKGQKLYKEKGMERSVVILDSPLTTTQFKRIAKYTGIYQWERYIDASRTPDWEKASMDWLEEGIDPDRK